MTRQIVRYMPLKCNRRKNNNQKEMTKTMTKTFIVKVTAKKGTNISHSRIVNAVQMAAPHPNDCGWNAECMEVVDAAPVALDYTLYAVGKKVKGEWRLFGFFDSKKRVENALRKLVDDLLRRFTKAEVAILEFSPSLGVWRVVGKPVKV